MFESSFKEEMIGFPEKGRQANGVTRKRVCRGKAQELCRTSQKLLWPVCCLLRSSSVLFRHLSVTAIWSKMEGSRVCSSTEEADVTEPHVQ